MKSHNFSSSEMAIDYLLDNSDRGLLMDRKFMKIRSDYNSYLIVEVKQKAAFIVYDNGDLFDGDPDFEEVDFTEAVDEYFPSINEMSCYFCEKNPVVIRHYFVRHRLLEVACPRCKKFIGEIEDSN